MAFNLGNLAPLAGLMESDKLLQQRQRNQMLQQQFMQEQQGLLALGNTLPQLQQQQQPIPSIPTPQAGPQLAGGSPSFTPPLPQVPNATGQMGGNVPLDRLTDEIYNLETSRGKDLSTSSAGALGPMQVMPQTARDYGATPADAADPVRGKQLGDRIVGDLYNRYKGNPDLTAIAYNAGPGYANKIQAGAPLSSLPGETRNYLAKMHRDLDMAVDQKGNQLINQGVDGLAVQDSTKLGMQAGREIDPVSYGRAMRSDLVKAIEKANPDADPRIKALAFLQLNKILAPEEKMQAQLWARENQQNLQLALADLRARTAERGQDLAVLRERESTAGALGRVEERIAAGGTGGRAPRFGSVDDLMQRWHDDFVKQQGREPTTEEIAGQHSELATESKPTGQMSKIIAERIGIGGNEVAKSVDAMTRLGPTATLGLFGGAQANLGPGLADNVKKNLANTMTPQSAQLLSSFSRGIGRGLAILSSAGTAQGLQQFSEQLKQEVPQAGDTGLTVLSKYANIREIAEAAIEVIQTDPNVKKNAELAAKMGDILQKVQKAVPFSRVDVAQLAASPDTQTIAQFMDKVRGQSEKHAVGDVIERGGKRYKVVGGDPNDPDVEEVK